MKFTVLILPSKKVSNMGYEPMRKIKFKYTIKVYIDIFKKDEFSSLNYGTITRSLWNNMVLYTSVNRASKTRVDFLN